MRWKPLFAVLLGLLMIGVTAGSAMATNVKPQQEVMTTYIMKNLKIIENKINFDFIQWYVSNKDKDNLPALNNSTITMLFSKFLEDNPEETKHLDMLTLLQKKLYEIGALKEHTSNIIDLQLYYPNQNFIKAKVSIKYFKIHLIIWTITYGEEDTLNIYYSGKYARDMYTKLSTYSEYGSWFLWLIGAPIFEISGTIAWAIWSTAGGLMIGTHQLNAYWESTDYQYFWVVLKNTYYYPYSAMTFSSHFELYLCNYNGNNYYLIPDTRYIPLPWLGLTAAEVSRAISTAAHNFVKKHGQDWVYIKHY